MLLKWHQQLSQSRLPVYKIALKIFLLNLVMLLQGRGSQVKQIFFSKGREWSENFIFRQGNLVIQYREKVGTFVLVMLLCRYLHLIRNLISEMGEDRCCRRILRLHLWKYLSSFGLRKNTSGQGKVRELYLSECIGTLIRMSYISRHVLSMSFQEMYVPVNINIFAVIFLHFIITIEYRRIFLVSSADPKVSSAELMVLLICLSSVVRRPSSSVVVRPSTFALNRYSSYSSYLIILNFLLEKVGI